MAFFVPVKMEEGSLIGIKKGQTVETVPCFNPYPMKTGAKIGV